MLRLELKTQDFYEVYRKLRGGTADELLLEVFESCPFLENWLAFKIIKSEAKRLGRKVVFVGNVARLSRLVASLNEATDSLGFVAGFDVASLLPKPTVSSRRRLTWPKFPRFSVKFLRVPWLPLVLLGLFLILGYSLYYFLPKATIKLTVEAESLIKSVDVVASPSAQAVLTSLRVIPATQISVSSRKVASDATTGSKEVGEKAKGEMTLYNKIPSAKSLPLRTVLTKGRTQGSDLLFLTEGEILVPPASDVSGVATISALAEKIGDEYNISAKSILVVSGSSTNVLIAENNKEFSGGSRRKITVVTEEDQRRLLASSRLDLEKSLTEEIRGKVVTGQILDEGSLTFSITAQNFDKELLAEAASFSLDLEEKAVALVYSQEDLKNLLGTVLAEHVPEGYKLLDEAPEIEVASVLNRDENLFLGTKVKGFIVPSINEPKIRADLAGLPLSRARQILDGLGIASSYQIIVAPRLPWVDALPRNRDSIKIEVERR